MGHCQGRTRTEVSLQRLFSSRSSRLAQRFRFNWMEEGEGTRYGVGTFDECLRFDQRIKIGVRNRIEQFLYLFPITKFKELNLIRYNYILKTNHFSFRIDLINFLKYIHIYILQSKTSLNRLSLTERKKKEEEKKNNKSLYKITMHVNK